MCILNDCLFVCFVCVVLFCDLGVGVWKSLFLLGVKIVGDDRRWVLS